MQKRHSKVFLFLLALFSLFFCSKIFADQSDAAIANRKTAVRCLKLARSYLSAKDWTNALGQTDLALSYDDSISDLWYFKAAALYGIGQPRAIAIPLVEKSLALGDWVDYNRDSARVLYADFLSDTGEYEKAISILDEAPFIYSLDAEYIRVKSYYRIRTEQSIAKARDKINSARKIYPDDKRFPLLFFKFEYDLARSLKTNGDSDFLVRKIADSFISKMPEYDNPEAELEIYATAFASGEQQKRMLQAFTAHGMSHPLYAIVALKVGLIGQQEAWDYFCSFADKSVDLEMFEEILPYITDQITVESVREHLNSFEGILLSDTDNDCEPNLKIQYVRGRPSFFEWDKNNDGICEWSSSCDFGVPEYVLLNKNNTQIFYGTFPYVTKIIYSLDSKQNSSTVFNLSDEEFSWSPFEIVCLQAVKNQFSADFFVPVVKNEVPSISEKDFFAFCSSYDFTSSEKPGVKIHFNVDKGNIISADYYNLEIPYAHAIFKDGIPYIKSVDNNGDGIFETTEFFDSDIENQMQLSKTEQEQLALSLFGSSFSDLGIYLKMIQIDTNADTIPDFTEEYFAGDSKITSWDFNGDGLWDVRFTRYPKAEDSDLIEEAQFYQLPEKNLVTITTKNSIPIKVQKNGTEFPVTLGASSNFYWVGQEGSAEDEKIVLENISLSLEQGVSILIQGNKNRMLAVKIAEKLYVQIIQDVE